MKPILFLAIAPLVTQATAANSFDIAIQYTGNESDLPVFQNAESIWEQIIPSYINGNQGDAAFQGIPISAYIGTIDGPGGVLGSAGPTYGGYDDSGYLLATEGEMVFDEADVGFLGDDLVTVILHEMGHVIGLGTLWTYNGLYVDGSGQYTGAAALAAFRSEFNQPDTSFVPVELGGGDGTADGHWDEGDGGFSTGLISSIHGSDMSYELMSGWLNTDQPYYISNVTRASLQDLDTTPFWCPNPRRSSCAPWVWFHSYTCGAGVHDAESDQSRSHSEVTARGTHDRDVDSPMHGNPPGKVELPAGNCRRVWVG